NESMNGLTKRLGMPNGHLTTLMRLTYLAPDIIRDCLTGHQPVGLTRLGLIRLSRDLPHDWSEQRKWMGWKSCQKTR
ncbi:MAG: recombinase family protein, partial [Pseudomonadota bacterium]